MKTTIVLAALLASTCFAQPSSQTGAAQRPPNAAARGAAPRPVHVGTNQQTGVDIDRFMGYAANSPVRLSHGTLLAHSILRAGDPYKPGAQGAVLPYRKDLSAVTLLGKNRTPLVTLPDQYFFYVESGNGRLEDGKQYWDLRENIALIVPPNHPHRFINLSDEPLVMIMVTWTPAVTPKAEILVRDINLLGYCEEHAHWNNTTKCIFGGPEDGLLQSEHMYLVMLRPWAVNQAHSHGPGTEEIWTKITPGSIPILLGSELRDMTHHSSYMVPPNGVTEHANLNVNKERTEWWLYVARGAAPGTTLPPMESLTIPPQQSRTPNPNINRDVKEAIVLGKPIN